MKSKDQIILEELYKKVKICESEDFSMVLSSGGNLRDFLNNFVGMTLKEFRDKESFYSLYQLNKHFGYAPKETKEGLLTNLIFELSAVLMQNMYLKTMVPFREEIAKKYNLDELNKQSSQFLRNKFRAEIAYRENPTPENKENLEKAKKEHTDHLNRPDNSHDAARAEEQQLDKQLHSQRIKPTDIFPNENWDEKAMEHYRNVEKYFNKLKNQEYTE